MTDEQQYKSSLEFYYYESRYRGWWHFDFPVPLEIPYHPFERKEPQQYTDDGKVPSLFKRLTNAFSPPEIVEVEETYYDFPSEIKRNEDFKVLKLSFRERIEISQVLSLEFLNMLSLTRDPMSFEIIGTGSEIWIQLSCSHYDAERVKSHLRAYFPLVRFEEVGNLYESIPFSQDDDKQIMIADFGLESEFMLPIARAQDFRIDPLTSVIAQFESLRTGSVAVLQVLFQGVRTPLAKDIMYSVSDGRGGSFFLNDPEMLRGAEEKVSSPLFACVIRLATQGSDNNHGQYLAKELISSISFGSDSGVNKLIPMSNKSYEYNTHVMNIFYRQSNRIGMILNAHELVSFVHYPNNTIVSEKLGGEAIGKLAPDSVQSNPYTIGINSVGKEEIHVSLTDEQRLSHTHVIGSTGMGKSTLLANMFVQDIELGLGAVMFDPHGDIVDDILLRIPESRKDDVILLDPSDTDFPLGFNLLHAESEAERLVLSSDLVSAFRKYATAWGDRMTSVLANAIDTFLDSDKGGTLIELKRFLLEKKFREQFLKTVTDPQLHYYWKHDFPLITRSSLSPLLTRIDTFLRPKIIRMMFAQKSGLDLADIVNNNKILLVKLSQGLIGKGNAHLLGTLLVSKLGQVALGRQALSKEERTPFYIYMDEFHHLMTDSIADMLSGVRKYSVGLVLAHQDMKQLGSDSELTESILSNPNVRICFRLGDTDAKALQTGFSGFEMNDLQSCDRGHAIMRVGGASNDFNISFPKLIDEQKNGSEIRNLIIERTRTEYAKPRAEVEQILVELLPLFESKVKEKEETPVSPVNTTNIIEETPKAHKEPKPVHSDDQFEQEVEKLKETAKKERIEREHEQLKVRIGTFAQGQGFRIVYEEETKSGGRVDIGLHNKEIRIACEISVTNTASYEVQNIVKCLEAEYDVVCMTSPSDEHLEAIHERAKKELSTAQLKKVKFLDVRELQTFIQKNKAKLKPQEKIIKGYRVKVKYSETDPQSMEEAQKTIAKTVLDNLKKKK